MYYEEKMIDGVLRCRKGNGDLWEACNVSQLNTKVASLMADIKTKDRILIAAFHKTSEMTGLLVEAAKSILEERKGC